MHQSGAAARSRPPPPPPPLHGLEAVKAAAAEAVAAVDVKFAAVRQTVSAMLRSGSRSTADVTATLLHATVETGGPANRARRRLSLPLGLYAEASASTAAAAAAAAEDAANESVEACLLSVMQQRGHCDQVRTQSPVRRETGRRGSLSDGRRRRMSPPRGPPPHGERGRSGRPEAQSRGQAVTPEAVRDRLIQAGILPDGDD